MTISVSIVGVCGGGGGGGGGGGEETDAESTLYYLLMKVVKGQPVVDAYRQRAPVCKVMGVWNLHS